MDEPWQRQPSALTTASSLSCLSVETKLPQKTRVLMTGHSSVAVQRDYTHLDLVNLRSAVEKCLGRNVIASSQVLTRYAAQLDGGGARLLELTRVATSLRKSSPT
jgi:hypothetical protein